MPRGRSGRGSGRVPPKPDLAGRVAPPVLLGHDAPAVPTYDYQCRSCGSVTEVIHSMLEDGPSVCERCGGVLRRVLFPAGIIFKGSGFYRNDSRNGGSTQSADGGSSQRTDADKSATPSGSSSKAPAKAAEPKASASEAEAPTG